MPRLLARHVVEATACETGVSVEALRSPSRIRAFVEPRTMAYFASVEMGVSPSEMGRAINRDHSTILQMVRLRTLTYEQRQLVNAIKLKADLISCEQAIRLANAFANGPAT